QKKLIRAMSIMTILAILLWTAIAYALQIVPSANLVLYILITAACAVLASCAVTAQNIGRAAEKAILATPGYRESWISATARAYRSQNQPVPEKKLLEFMKRSGLPLETIAGLIKPDRPKEANYFEPVVPPPIPQN